MPKLSLAGLERKVVPSWFENDHCKRERRHLGRLSVMGHMTAPIRSSALAEEAAPPPAMSSGADQPGTTITRHWITSFPLLNPMRTMWPTSLEWQVLPWHFMRIDLEEEWFQRAALPRKVQLEELLGDVSQAPAKLVLSRPSDSKLVCGPCDDAKRHRRLAPSGGRSWRGCRLWPQASARR